MVVSCNEQRNTLGGAGRDDEDLDHRPNGVVARLDGEIVGMAQLLTLTTAGDQLLPIQARQGYFCQRTRPMIIATWTGSLNWSCGPMAARTRSAKPGR